MKTYAQTVEWLCYRDIYDKVVKYLKEEHRKTGVTDSLEDRLKTDGYYLFAYLFEWDHTKEGIDFWASIDKDFRLFWDSPKNLITESHPVLVGVVWKNDNESISGESLLELFPEAEKVEETKTAYVFYKSAVKFHDI